MAEEPRRGLARSHSVRSSRSTTSAASNVTQSARTASSASRLDAKEVRRVLDRLKAELDRERLARKLLMKEKAEEERRLRAEIDEVRA